MKLRLSNSCGTIEVETTGNEMVADAHYAFDTLIERARFLDASEVRPFADRIKTDAAPSICRCGCGTEKK